MTVPRAPPPGGSPSSTADGRGTAELPGDDFAPTALDEPAPAPSAIVRLQVPSLYEETDGAIYMLQGKLGRGAPTRLSNFTARIVEEQIVDNGVDEQRRYVVSGLLSDGTVLPTVVLAASAFQSMTWVAEQWGARAVITAGMGMRDHLRAAIQELSAPREVRIYAHSGWRPLGDGWMYLTAGGAVGPLGPLPEERVEFIDVLSRLQFPPAPESGSQQHRDNVHALLRVLDVGPDYLGVALLSAPIRAVLGEALPVDFAFHIVGKTGGFKSELAALAQGAFGAGFGRLSLPGAWGSTANHNEELAFQGKDAVCVIDDYKPTGSPTDVARMKGEAARIFRASGNRAGRGRMRSDLSLVPGHPPRALIVSTGEDTPPGESIAARIISAPVRPGLVDEAVLSAAQSDRDAGRYAAVMAAYVQHLAQRMDDLIAQLPGLQADYRQAVPRGPHRRTVDWHAGLIVAWETFLDFAEATDSISREERAQYMMRVHDGLDSLMAEQHEAVKAEDFAATAMATIASRILARKCHVASDRNGPPDDPESWGWEKRIIGTGENVRVEWSPRGNCVGWRSSEEPDRVFIDPTQFYKELEAAMPRDAGMPFRPRALWGLFDAKSWIVEKEQSRHTVRRMLAKKRHHVIALRVELFDQELPLHEAGGPSGPGDGDDQ